MANEPCSTDLPNDCRPNGGARICCESKQAPARTLPALPKPTLGAVEEPGRIHAFIRRTMVFCRFKRTVYIVDLSTVRNDLGMANQLMRLRTFLWGEIPCANQYPEENSGPGYYEPNTRQKRPLIITVHCFFPRGQRTDRFSPSSEMQRTWEKKFQAILEAPQDHARHDARLSARPHHSGSPYDKDKAEWILDRFSRGALTLH